MLKKISIIVFLILIISTIGGYFYFNEKFTPPANQLQVDKGDDVIKIKWPSNASSDIAALLLPVKLVGISQTFYMQFDLGSHSTLLYKKSFESLKQLYPDQIVPSIDSGHLQNYPIKLGKLEIKSKSIRLLNYGNAISPEDTSSVNIIGTIGADFIEKKIVAIDFAKGLFYLKDQIDLSMANFSFSKRKVLLPAVLNGSDLDLLYDSGSSGFELITNESTWNEIGDTGAETTSFNVNSWGKSLTAYTLPCNSPISLGSSTLNLNSVTYIEGTSFIQNTLMRASGMGGMIGNKLFMEKVLVLDGKNEEFAILDKY